LTSPSAIQVALLTREYPPEIYGGAGVHVDELARVLRRQVALSVFCFGQARDRPEVAGAYQPWPALQGDEAHLAALRAISVDLLMAKAVRGAHLVHSHTWYANLAGHLAKLLYGIPHVVTCHSLEPLRPWKAEQLGGGYALSSLCERLAIESADAVIAVSASMRDDVLRCYKIDPARVVVIHNGVDSTQYRHTNGGEILRTHGIDQSASRVVFVGRITRQKGLTHLLAAAEKLRKDAQLVLCAGEADTAQALEEVRQRVLELRSSGRRVIWIDRMLQRHELMQMLSYATVFVCPSVYEPFGIVNLEAMACGAPVVASAVGGIPEVVEDGVTGLLVRFEPDGSAAGEPREPLQFAGALAAAINTLIDDPDRAKSMGEAGCQRVMDRFSWERIGEQTVALYRRLLGVS
jgi:starch synthase